MTSLSSNLSSNRTRQALSQIVFSIVTLASFAFWVVELNFALSGYAAQANELLEHHQQYLLEHQAESIRDLTVNLYQSARIISLLPAIRDVKGGNRHSVHENVVQQGRLSIDTHQMLQQVYANLAAYVRLSEIYYVLDGFAPEKGEVPFFMYDDAARPRIGTMPGTDQSTNTPDEDEAAEYAEIVQQLAWFKSNAPVFRYAAELNAIPSRISPMVKTCDVSQFTTSQTVNERDQLGFVYSVPVYDTHSNRFKGQISVIVRSNVFEAQLVNVPFLPITEGDTARMNAQGWIMPPPSPFVLTEKSQRMEIFDRRNPLFQNGFQNARNNPSPKGRWTSIPISLKSQNNWELHHYLPESEIQEMTSGIERNKLLSVASRVLLLFVLSGFLWWGFRLMHLSRRELVKMSHYDPLTDLPNRRLFFERMESGIEQARLQNTHLGLFFLDLAGLNAINDRHGHHGGDKLLKQMTNRLHARLRKTEHDLRKTPDAPNARDTPLAMQPRLTLFRLGGDEFTIIYNNLPAPGSPGDLSTMAEHIVACVSHPFILDDEAVDIGLNVGAASFPNDADNAERLLMSADSAMHECKNTHSRFILFNEEMRQRAERLHLLTLELVGAVQREQFELYYQPKVTLLDGRVASMEALIRWHHPELGMVSPLEFIPILEANGAIVELGEWIVEQACRDLHHLSEAGYPEIMVSVNVSVRQLRQGNFLGFLEKTLAQTGIEASRLILEMTETIVMDDLEKGREILLSFRKLGISLAIDDFGTGYSSLSYLQHLPLDYLKIDKSLIDGMVDERSVHVVASLISLAQGLTLKTIAEGIETAQQRDLVQQLGCNMIQGYLLSRPLPLAAIIDWLDARGQSQG